MMDLEGDGRQDRKRRAGVHEISGRLGTRDLVVSRQNLVKQVNRDFWVKIEKMSFTLQSESISGISRGDHSTEVVA